MNETDIDDRADLERRQGMSEVDFFDLANSVRLKNPIEEIAMFLCRSRGEVPDKLPFGSSNTRPRCRYETCLSKSSD
jgi:hypothetical protein